MVAATRIAPLPEEIDDKKRQFRAGNSDPEKEPIVAETPEDESNGRQSLHEPVKFRSKLILQLQPIEMIPHWGRSEIRKQIPSGVPARQRLQKKRTDSGNPSFAQILLRSIYFLLIFYISA